MEWQTTDWFFVLIFLAFIAMHFVDHSGPGSHDRADSQPPSAKGQEGEGQGPVINM